MYQPEQFADFQQYVEIANELRSTKISELFYFESLSRLMLKAFAGENLIETHTWVSILSYIHSITIVALISIIWARSRSSPLTFFIAIALFGPLLIFVTLRASIAYLLVTFAILTTTRNQKSPILMIFIAAQFHATAYLAIPLHFLAEHLSKINTRTKNPKIFIRNPIKILLISASGISIFREQGLALTASLTSSFDAAGDFGKFLVYTTLPSETISTAHYIYFSLISILTAFMLKMHELRNDWFMWYFLSVSFFVYCILNISPVVGYRFSIYFIFPSLLSIKSQQLPRRPIALTSIALLSIAVATANFSSVLEK